MPQVKRITGQDVRDWEKRKTTPPPPFTLAPSELHPFFETLDPSKVYVIHIDRFPAAFKQRIFTVPVVLNLGIAVLLVWRFYAIIPWYLSLIDTLRGSTASPTTIDPSSHATRTLVWTVIRRGATFFLDFVLLRIVLPWPVSFFLERPANPVSWRWRCGFRDEEVVVRESRGWTAVDLLAGTKAGEDSPFFKTRVLPAVDRRYCAEKTGYLMMGKDWDLDFFGMIQAHAMVYERKDVGITLFEKSVLAHKDGIGWLVWRVHELDRHGEDEEQRRKIVALKDKLTAIGKESLFFRWIEIVQYESSKPGTFDRARQEQTMEIVRSEFEKQGVDFEALAREIGGLEGTPGMGNQ